MLKTLSLVKNNAAHSQEAQPAYSWLSLREYEVKHQPIYYEVHVECSNPKIAPMDPIVLKSDLNLPEKCIEPLTEEGIYNFILGQVEKCKKINELLLKEALIVQETLQAHYKSKPDNYEVIIVQRKR